MRNLKRALSLALAAVMLIGMMIVGTSAASVSDFSDSTQITHTEAASVIAGLQIVSGYEDGTFRPDRTVTRAEMAVFVGRMVHGAAVDPAMFADEKIFSDYDGWSNGWVNLAYNDGIISGRGNGIFDPSGTLNVGEAATIILKALGVSYDEANWPMGVMAKAAELKLFGDMVVTSSMPMTRDMVAAITFEGLVYSPSGTTGYKVPGLDIVFDNFIEAYLANSGSASGISQVTAKDSLASRIFGLTSEVSTDELGLPTTVYTATNPKAEITVPGATASITITKAASGADLAAHQKSVGLTGYTIDKDATILVDGYNANAGNKFDNTADTDAGKTARMTQLLGDTNVNSGLTNANATVYVYTSGKVIQSVVVVNEKLAMVTRVTAASGDKAATITVAGKDVEATGFEQGDYVLYNQGKDDDGNDVIVNVRKCDSFVGTVTRYTSTGSGKYTIGGVEYEVNTGLASSVATTLQSNLGKELTVWTDANGKIVAVKVGTAAAAQSNYLYVIGNSASQTSTDYMNNSSTVIQITAVNTAGEISNHTVSKVTDGDGTEEDLTTSKYDSNNALRGHLYSYVENNGTLEITEVTSDAGSATIAAGATSISNNGDGTAILNNSTNFVFVEYATDGTITTAYKALTVKLGNTNIGDGFDQNKALVVAKDGVAQTVFIAKKYTDATTSSGNIVYFNKGRNECTVNTIWENNAPKTVTSFVVYDVNGGKMTLTKDGDQSATAPGVYYYNTDNTLGGAVTGTYKTGTINEVRGNTIEVKTAGSYVYLNITNAQIAYIGKDYQLQKGQTIAYVLHADPSTVVDNIWVTGDTETVTGNVGAAMKAGQTDKFDVVLSHDTLVAGDGVKNTITVTISKKGTGTFEDMSTIEVTPNEHAEGSTVYTLSESEKDESTTSVTFTFTLTGTGDKDVLPSLYFEVAAAPCDHTTRTETAAGDAAETACNAKTNVQYWTCTCGKHWNASTGGTEIADVNTVDGTKHTAVESPSTTSGYVKQWDSTNNKWQHAVECQNGSHAAGVWEDCSDDSDSDKVCNTCGQTHIDSEN